MIERNIITGLITNTEYLSKIKGIWNDNLLEAPAAKLISSWCWEYFELYNEAPKKHIERIYFQKVKEGLPQDIAEMIEEDILPDLSEEYVNSDFNLEYLLDQTFEFVKERKLTILKTQIAGLIEDNKLSDAEDLIDAYTGVLKQTSPYIDLSHPKEAEDAVKRAFAVNNRNLIYYPGALGKFWNAQLIRGGFVALMASEKRGKTFTLIDMAMRGCKQGRKVAFFQAGDMTETEQIRRICIYLAKKSDKKEYIGEMYEPVKDCVLNQLDTCDYKERESNQGVFEGRAEEQLRQDLTQEEIIEAFKDNPNYKPCYNCKKYEAYKLGSPWVKKVDVGKNPLGEAEATKFINKFFVEYKRQFKLASYANGTLTIKEIEAVLATWKKEDGYTPDIIITDYADLFDSPTKEFRHKQNEIWKGHRALCQKYDCLVITATQADADSYDKDLLTLRNFSEDKRKFAHVTAMYGLNRDRAGREKEIGVIRLNELVIREGDFASTNQVYVLQNLKRGRPVLGSYFSKNK